MLDRLTAGLARLVDLAVIVGGGLLALIVGYNVFSRYVLAADLAWSNELAIFLLVWTSFLAAAAASHRGAHLRVLEILNLLPPGPRRWVEILIQLTVTAMLGWLVWYGWAVAARNMAQLTTVLYWPVGLLYAACPVGAALMLIFTLHHLVRLARG